MMKIFFPSRFCVLLWDIFIIFYNDTKIFDDHIKIYQIWIPVCI